MKPKPYTTKQLANLEGVTMRAINKKIKLDQQKPKELRHYPNVYQCDCEQHSYLIPRSDVDKNKL